jgi:PAS domain S-box-containing protein
MATVSEIAWIANADGSMIDFNPRWYEYSGLGITESLAWGFLKAVHPEDRDRILCATEQTSTDQQSYSFNLRILAATGTYHWFKAQATPVVAGGVVEWVGTYTAAEEAEGAGGQRGRGAEEAEGQRGRGAEEAEGDDNFLLIVEEPRLTPPDIALQPEFLTALLTNLSDGIVACDANGVLRLFNPATQEFHGLPQEAIPAEQWAEYYDLYHPDGTLMQAADVPLFRALNGENVRNVEIKIRAKNGTVRTVLSSGNAIFNAAGEKLGAVVAMRDITERKQAEAALKQSEQKLLLHVQQTPLAVIEWNLNFKVTDWNKSAETIFGYTKQEALGRHATELIIPEKFKNDVSHLWNDLIALQGGTRSTNENFTKDGRKIICEWYNTPLRDHNGNVIGVASLAQDITNRVQAESALRENQERLAGILETIPNGIVTINLAGEFTSANPAAEKILGLKRSEISERVYNDPAWKITTLDGKPFPDQDLPFARVMRTHQALCGVEHAIEHQDGSRTMLSVSAAPLRNGLAEMVGVVAAISDVTQSKQIEAERDRFFNLSIDLLCTAGLDGYFRRINPAFETTLGYTKEELLSQPWVNFVHPEDQAATLADLDNLATGTPTFYFQNRYICKDGSFKWLSWTAFPVVEENLVYAVARDITASKQMEETLRQREQEFKALLDNTPDVVLRCDRDLRYVYVNAEVERTTGMPAASFIGKTLRELGSPPDLCEIWETTLRKVFEKNEEQEIEFEGVTLEGLRIYQSRFVPELNDEGLTEYALIVSRDITELKQAELEIRTLNAELEQRVTQRTTQLETANLQKDKLLVLEQQARSEAEAAQQRYQDLVNGLVDAIVWECDPVTLQFSFVSQSAEKILGYPVESWLTQLNFWASLIHPEDREEATNFCSEETLAGRDHEFDYRCIAADGRVVWLRDRAYIVRDANGKVQKMRGLMVDITQQKQAEAEKEQAEAAIKARADELAKMAAFLAKTNAVLEKRNQELDQFAYVTSHDLKAPLRAIANLSSWIEEDLEDALTDETRHQMQLLRGRVHRMEALINALLEYSRIGRIKNQIQRVNINDLLAEIIEAIAPPPQFTIEVEPNMPTIVTEVLPLQQVFTNLITNAIKHHDREDGRVKISVQDQGKFYKFIVSDDGTGIAPQFHDKIFVIFQTLQARDKVENTGVGLALVKKIIEHQGGNISLESAEGQGATFSFTWHK